jgi:hypothetical protein
MTPENCNGGVSLIDTFEKMRRDLNTSDEEPSHFEEPALA